jgi:hypothetical protein
MPTIGIAALVAVQFVSRASAHEFWRDARRVAPATKKLCCGENDCRSVPLEVAHATHDGYHLDDTEETIPWSRVQPSPDGEMWCGRWGAQTQYFFAPPLGS